ncbi:GvpL/GvpF family gas vesicle protein [Methanocalculus sp.]|uniref:GvpL/GvpF family gas vesicle protein n=1 Tax=Methanocalculus sp. TaxID=2004547 RepID=UPI00272D8718|nr:GvpL/GvpF family gas vesicle protein [Methanocalculus sp.]
MSSSTSRPQPRGSGREKKKTRYRYVYGIITSKKPCDFGTIGIDGAEVVTLHFRDIAAVISDAGSDRYEILDHGVNHQQVVEQIAEEYTILPMGFGHISTEQDVISFLQQHYRTIKAMEKKITGMVELGVRAQWKMDAVMEAIAAENAAIATLRDQIKGRSEKDSYRMQIDLGKRIAQELEKRRDQLSRKVVSALGGHAADTRVSTPKSDKTVLNAAFLVPVQKEADFDLAVNTVEEQYRTVLHLSYFRSPPYSFINLRVR